MHGRPPVPRFLARPAAWLYGRIVAQRNRRFDARKGVIEFDRPTISVGNLSVGGTGKTPMVMHVLSFLSSAGHHPCIAMRGYKAGAGESDEAAEYARAFPDIPVVAQPDRVDGLIRLFGSEAGEITDAIVLDDGFQHRRIARDLDIVMVDATRDPFADALLPLGWLREPVASLSRAGAFVITHAEAVGESRVRDIERSLAAVSPGVPIATTAHAWSELRVVEMGIERSEPTAWLKGRVATAACAIGNPQAFLAQLKAVAAREPAATTVLRDHDHFGARPLTHIIESARATSAAAIVVTEKDWSKLRRVRPDAWPCPVVRPRLTLEFRSGRDTLETTILERIRARPYVPPQHLTDDPTSPN